MTWLTSLYVALALLSAAMWLAASLVRVPKPAWFIPRLGAGFDPILKKLRLQSRLNAAGAFLMATSVLIQLVEFIAAP